MQHPFQSHHVVVHNQIFYRKFLLLIDYLVLHLYLFLHIVQLQLSFYLQDLISEKRKLEIEPEANKKRLSQIDKELEKLSERREANLEIIAKGDEKLKEIDEARNNLADKKITITITYNNHPSLDAIHNYAEKLKKTIDSKMPAS